MISKVKAQQWTPRECSKPVWVIEDRPPGARSVSRAVAIVGSFIEKTLCFSKDKLEVDNWQAARAYLGDMRISGAFPGAVPSPPPRRDDYVVWPVVDSTNQVSVWCDLQAIASTTGIDVSEVHRRWTLQQKQG